MDAPRSAPVLFLTVEEVAQRYRTSPSTVRYWRQCQVGPRSVKIGRRVLFAIADLDAYDAQLRAEADRERRSRPTR